MSRTLHHVTTVDVVLYLSTDDHSSAKFIIVYVDGMYSDGFEVITFDCTCGSF